MVNRRIWHRFDWFVLFIALLLILFGVAMIRSATLNSPSLQSAPLRHAISGLIGLVLLLLTASVDYRILGYLKWPLYVLTLLLLVGVIYSGKAAGGAQRWLVLGPIMFQPSEFVKLFIIVVMARFLADREGEMHKWSNFLLAILLLVPPVVLIYKEPDLGTAIAVLFVGGVMILMSGVSLAHVAVSFGATLVAIPIVWQHLHGYMRERILSFVNPSLDATNYNNVRQALISIGSGGLLGQGYGKGSQNQLHFLRVRYTDFIFSVIAEEWGFIGTVIFLLILLIFLLRLIRQAERAQDQFGRLLITGVVTLIYFQVFVNIGMTMRLMPVTGIPLPFVSYGRSSLITLMLGLGLVESVIMHSKKLEFG